MKKRKLRGERRDGELIEEADRKGKRRNKRKFERIKSCTKINLGQLRKHCQ